MNKLESIKYKFYFEEDGSFNLQTYGQFRAGLTTDEVKDYLRARGDTLNVKRLYNKFCDIAGRNTMGCFTCEKCGDMRGLLYRHDVLRFADVLFGKTKGTYFD